MTDTAGGGLDEIRSVLFSSEREELEMLRRRVAELEALQARVGRLEAETKRLDELEAMLLKKGDRAMTVAKVLPAAVDPERSDVERLSIAMKPSTTRAIHYSARDESGDLALALYPVIGPAVRKMIANMFSVGTDGASFTVRQVLLIERESGLLLASSALADEDAQDADIVSGMLDAIRLFVQDAFDASEDDGLQDLRVGNTSVLVEWGPQAVLASVVDGPPDEAYRIRAAKLLELLHVQYESQLSADSGISETLDEAVPLLHDLQGSPQPERSGGLMPLVRLLFVVGFIALVVYLVWFF